jgi:hypothetical protein
MNEIEKQNIINEISTLPKCNSDRKAEIYQYLFEKELKYCPKCKSIFNISSFRNAKKRKYGKEPICKRCESVYSKRWSKKNQDKIKQKRLENKPEYQARIKYRRKNEPEFRQRARERSRKYYYNPKNKDKIRLRNKLLMRKKLLNPYNRVVANLRRRIPAVLKGEAVKSAPTFKLLGCDRQQLVVYLESQFQPGMSWDNYGFGHNKWVIDHILPCASFDLSKPEEQRKCFHYTNLQPLWWRDNLAKSDTIPNYGQEGGTIPATLFSTILQ